MPLLRFDLIEGRTDDEIQTLSDRNIPVAVLYQSGNDYAAAMENLSKEQALVAVQSSQNTALGDLTQSERDMYA